MVTPSAGQAGVASIRVWIEKGDPPALRVRFTRCDDVADPIWVSDAYSTAEDGVAGIEAWLLEYQRACRAGRLLLRGDG